MKHSLALHEAPSVCAELGMRVLHFTPTRISESVESEISTQGHDVVTCVDCADALRMIVNESFNAVVIENEDEDMDVIDFTIAVHGIDPQLPVFLTSDWGPDLPRALEDIGNGAFAVAH